MSSTTENLLLTLAYLLFADRNHLQRLHSPGESINVAQDALSDLARRGLIEELRWSIVITVTNPETGARRKQPVRQPSMWQLTEAGHDLIKHHFGSAHGHCQLRRSLSCMLRQVMQPGTRSAARDTSPVRARPVTAGRGRTRRRSNDESECYNESLSACGCVQDAREEEDGR